jgi:hypothetical protein
MFISCHKDVLERNLPQFHYDLFSYDILCGW